MQQSGEQVTGFNEEQGTAPTLYNLASVELWLGHQQAAWQLIFPQPSESLLLDTSSPEGAVIKASVFNQLAPTLKAEDWADHRQAVTLEGCPFLMGVFYETRTIRLYTPQLRDELFYLDVLTQENLSADPNFWQHVQEVVRISQEAAPSIYEQICQAVEEPPRLDPGLDAIEKRTQEIVGELLPRIKRYKPTLFEDLNNWALGLAADYPVLRVYLLKFIALLPWLEHDTTGDLIKPRLQEAFRRTLQQADTAAPLVVDDLPKPPGYLPWWLRTMLRLMHGLITVLPQGLVAWGAKFGVGFVARRFILGRDLAEAKPSLEKLWGSGRDATLDPLGELIVSPEEAKAYEDKILSLIETFDGVIPQGEKNGSGFYRAHISIKLSALTHDYNPIAPEAVYEEAGPRLKTILLKAQKHQVFITCDAEHFATRNLTVYMLRRVLLETPELHDYDQVGVVLQGYLRDSYEHLQELIALGKERGLPLPIRLVKGAYWDAETIEAEAHGWPAPQFLNKSETDLNVWLLMRSILENYPAVQLTFGSHNFTGHAHAEALRELVAPDHPPVEHQCLSRTYEALSQAMRQQGWVVRDYVPIGDLIVGMAYLVRRIMENASQVGVLTKMRTDRKSRGFKLPSRRLREHTDLNNRQDDSLVVKLEADFANVAPARLFLPEERRVMQAALEEVRQQLGQPLEQVFMGHGEVQTITSPSDNSVVVGKITTLTKDNVEWAIHLAEQQFTQEGGWAHWPKSRRVTTLLNVANRMQVERFIWAAWIVYESGKAITEALADVDEAIDFLRFYAREEAKLPESRPRGPIAVIAPWNFPLAIPCGMVSAALVGGNPVVVKSAGQTPLIVERFVRLCHEEGVPYEALIHAPGKGSIVGKVLAEDPRIAGLVFTGSYEVGRRLQRQMATRLYTNPVTGERYPVQVVAETGGKNAIIVTSTADLDETVAGILYSAFAHAGQKCSAASRVIIHDSVYPILTRRLKQACEAIAVGASENWGTRINPVITQADAYRLRAWVKAAIEEAEQKGGNGLVNRSEPGPGYPSQCVGPAVIEVPMEEGINPKSYTHYEAFGPVMHVMPYHTLNEAIALFNSVPYGLTGGIFSQSDDQIDHLLPKLEAGNIYLNRSITGARVAIEPFGGYKASGTGPKAGSPELVQAFQLGEQAEFSSLETPQANALPAETSKRKPLKGLPLGQPVRNSFTSRKETLLHVLRTWMELDIAASHEVDYTVATALIPWLEEEAEAYVSAGYPNRITPGQNNWMDIKQPRPLTVVAVGRAELAPSTLQQSLITLLAGGGLTTVSWDATQHKKWTQLRDHLIKAGLPEKQWVHHPWNETAFADQLISLLDEPRLTNVVLDGAIDWIEAWLPLAFGETDEPAPFRKVSTPLDHPPLGDVPAYWKLQAQTRAIAENTLRHGANLAAQERRFT